MYTADQWKDYTLLDCGGGMKLEDWAGVILARPDPQAIWEKTNPKAWERAHAVYTRSASGGGSWDFRKPLPESWRVRYRSLTFLVRPTGFKHTGLFPEQAANWDFMGNRIAGRKNARVLNLFAYTGAATLACAKAGAEVTHVDAAKSMVSWAKENAAASRLSDRPIRFLIDDCMKFLAREARRGSVYDGIVMDPPSYGRSAGGRVFKSEKDLFGLVGAAAKLLSPQPLFLLINSYTTGLSPTVCGNLVKIHLSGRGHVECGELCLPIVNSGLCLPCGATTRWTP